MKQVDLQINGETVSAGDIFMVIIDEGVNAVTKNLTSSDLSDTALANYQAAGDIILNADDTAGDITLNAGSSTGDIIISTGTNPSAELNLDGISNLACAQGSGNWVLSTLGQYNFTAGSNTSNLSVGFHVTATAGAGGDIILTGTDSTLNLESGAPQTWSSSSQHINISGSVGVNITDGISTIDFDRTNASIDITTQSSGDGEINIDAGLSLILASGGDIRFNYDNAGVPRITNTVGSNAELEYII